MYPLAPNNKEIYFHVGLGKVASTYLQYRFFPKLQGIQYIQRTKYRQYQRHIEAASAQRILISREFDNQLEYEVARFAKHYPDTHVIIAFRRQDGWIASQYRRYVKNGGHRSFSQFIDVEQDTGLWKQDQIYFMPKIRIIEKYFHKKPLILFHDDLKKDAFAFFDQIAHYTQSTYDKSTISLAPVHKSYSEKQLKFIRSVAGRFFQEPKGILRVKPEKGIRHWINRRSKMLACYATMYSSAFFPENWAGEAPLILPEEKEKVRAFYAEDWDALLRYAKT